MMRHLTVIGLKALLKVCSATDEDEDEFKPHGAASTPREKASGCEETLHRNRSSVKPTLSTRQSCMSSKLPRKELEKEVESILNEFPDAIHKLCYRESFFKAKYQSKYRILLQKPSRTPLRRKPSHSVRPTVYEGVIEPLDAGMSLQTNRFVPSGVVIDKTSSTSNNVLEQPSSLPNPSSKDPIQTKAACTSYEQASTNESKSSLSFFDPFTSVKYQSEITSQSHLFAEPSNSPTLLKEETPLAEVRGPAITQSDSNSALVKPICQSSLTYNRKVVGCDRALLKLPSVGPYNLPKNDSGVAHSANVDERGCITDLEFPFLPKHLLTALLPPEDPQIDFIVNSSFTHTPSPYSSGSLLSSSSMMNSPFEDSDYLQFRDQQCTTLMDWGLDSYLKMKQ
eukprot:GHVH01000922.1.p1 GENE.GHVH01000922.1~~GHVH01000922.1.p1  ORF type:complete len:396 (+),score=43.48 GHVH01000922.1:374-1561(+)